LEVDEVQFYFFASIGRLIFFVGCRIGGIPSTKALLEIPRASAAAFVAASARASQPLQPRSATR
jgi:hypothetical protein